MSNLPLASEFPPAQPEAWERIVEKALKGAGPASLVSKTYDGLTVAPLSPRAAGALPVAGRAAGSPWQVMQRADHPDPAAANRQALADLENGAAGLSLVFAGSAGAHGFGLDGSEQALAAALDGVFLDAGISLELDLGPETMDAGAALARLVKARGTAPDATDIRFGFDPIGAMAADGSAPLAWSGLARKFAGAVGDIAGQGFRGPFAAADGRVVHNAGGSEAQELAFALGCAIEYLRALEAAGVPLDEARRMIFVRMSADSDQFLTIAKLRALRKLWAHFEQASGLAPRPVFISAETAWRTMTRRDPYVNMLRATMAVFAAGVGGADAVTVLPFTLALGLPDPFARRVARNTQLVLLEESNLAKVADPAAGTGIIETLTEELSAAAWKLFQECESAGGMAAALARGGFQEKVLAVGAERVKALSEGREALIGTTIYRDAAETPVEVLPVIPAIRAKPPGAIGFPALPGRRLAEPFE